MHLDLSGIEYCRLFAFPEGSGVLVVPRWHGIAAAVVLDMVRETDPQRLVEHATVMARRLSRATDGSGDDGPSVDVCAAAATIGSTSSAPMTVETGIRSLAEVVDDLPFRTEFPVWAGSELDVLMRFRRHRPRVVPDPVDDTRRLARITDAILRRRCMGRPSPIRALVFGRHPAADVLRAWWSRRGWREARAGEVADVAVAYRIPEPFEYGKSRLWVGGHVGVLEDGIAAHRTVPGRTVTTACLTITEARVAGVEDVDSVVTEAVRTAARMAA